MIQLERNSEKKYWKTKKKKKKTEPHWAMDGWILSGLKHNLEFQKGMQAE